MRRGAASAFPWRCQADGLRKLFFGAVVRAVQATRVSLAPVQFFWADERRVPPDDPESNFGLAHRWLLAPLGVPEAMIHRIQAELPGEHAAAEAEAALRRFVSADYEGQPVLDLVLLGMGEDGHVAALFPTERETAASGTASYLAVNDSPKPPSRRVTLGYGPLRAARRVWVLASGQGKEKALRDSLAESGDTPLARVIRSHTQTRLFTDIPGV
jgi:6-phosphogluconolactonase